MITVVGWLSDDNQWTIDFNPMGYPLEAIRRLMQCVDEWEIPGVKLRRMVSHRPGIWWDICAPDYAWDAAIDCASVEQLRDRLIR